MKIISNERPGILVLEKYSHCGIAWCSDGEMKLLKYDNSQSSHRWHHMYHIYFLIFFSCFCIRKYLWCKTFYLFIKNEIFMIQIHDFV